jgi:hypothetical protein
MSKTFRPWKIDEPLLLPPVVQEFVVKDHLARFELNLVRDDINLVEITSSYAADPMAAEPELMSVVLHVAMT